MTAIIPHGKAATSRRRRPTGCQAATALATAIVLSVPAIAEESIVLSPHNLSATGPGTVRALNESEICIFCHVPHNADPQAPLWNRYNPTTYYRIYDSSTMDARIDQPGGPSKMCLSCHDGSIALGLVLSRPMTDPIVMNQPFMPTGPSNLTNDLSDDHPIGFRFDRQLSNRDKQLRTPDQVSQQIKLGRLGQLECTACHDAHNNELGNFLRITDRQGALCNTCHKMTGWQLSAHALARTSVPVNVTNGQQIPFGSMAEAACASCHVSHSANHPEWLLRNRSFELCIGCHNGLSGPEINTVLNQLSGHRASRFFDVHDPAENPLTMRTHVDCTDCHNPHAVLPNPLASSNVLNERTNLVPPAMAVVSGVSSSGLPVPMARFEYEVCFKCHADNPVPVDQTIVRQRDAFGNLRFQFLPTAASAHPVVIPTLGGADVPSLLPSARTITVMSCQACHNNPSARQLGGAGPNGPHGSRFNFLLAAQYETADFTMESPQSYALCYQCHDRNSILSDQSFPYHRVHIVNGRSPCSACHDPHGVTGSRTRFSNLMNFDISIVGGQRLYLDTGQFSGSCTLTCHGVNHVNFVYGP